MKAKFEKPEKERSNDEKAAMGCGYGIGAFILFFAGGYFLLSSLDGGGWTPLLISLVLLIIALFFQLQALRFLKESGSLRK